MDHPLLPPDHLILTASPQTAKVGSWRLTVITTVSISLIRTDSSSATLTTAIYVVHTVYVWTPTTTCLWLSGNREKWNWFKITCSRHWLVHIFFWWMCVFATHLKWYHDLSGGYMSFKILICVCIWKTNHVKMKMTIMNNPTGNVSTYMHVNFFIRFQKIWRCKFNADKLDIAYSYRKSFQQFESFK